MEANIIAIHWHNDQAPIYSAHFQPGDDSSSTSSRLATGGGDNNVRIWRVTSKDDGTGNVNVEYLSTLAKHTQAVNVVRFDPKGEILASAGDDGTVLLWSKSDNIVREFGADPEDEVQESWIMRHVCRSSTSEIYDIAWSPDSKYIITGSTDNVTRIYDSSTGQLVNQIAEHAHYVQGVAFDPLGKLIATQSADRSVHIYSLNPSPDGLTLSPTVFYKSTRAELPTRHHHSIHEDDLVTVDVSEDSRPPSNPPSSSASSMKSPRSPSPALPAVRAQTLPPLNFSVMKGSMLYHTESLRSFFRRLSFSPDGNFLFTPSGIFKNTTTSTTTTTTINNNTNNTEDAKEELLNTVYIYSRKGLNKPPIAHLPGLTKPALVISFSPIFYELDTSLKTKPVIQLPYKMVYAVGTLDSVYIYDTQREDALGHVSSIHYGSLTDLTWNSDGDSLIVSSNDGFCTCLKFKEGELGQRLTVDYKSLLPEVESDSKTNMASPAAPKKRSNTSTTSSSASLIDSITKKAKTANFTKPDSSSPSSSNFMKSNNNEQEFIDLSSTSPSKETKSKEITVDLTTEENYPPVVHNPPVKQKKRVSPTLVTSTQSKP